MAYNNLSGCVAQPNEFLPRKSIYGNVIVPIISGNLATSDASSVINIPRVSNAVNNAIVTNVGGDANDFTCESSLTFDGDTLNVVGDISASIGVSASYFIGDGSRLTGILGVSGSDPDGPVTSIQFATGTPSHLRLTGSSQLLFSSSVLIVGAGLSYNRIRVTESYSILANDYYIGIDTSANISPIVVTLPSASLLQSGQTYVVKDEGGAANTKNVTISASVGETIDGSNTVILESPYASIQLYCNGSNKFYIC
tara:strand:- start:2195 stop:2956 length:762 start_codon:yes stop_codon:yes gene_type:complete